MKNSRSIAVFYHSLRLLAVASLLGLASCASVTCKVPAGDKPAHLEADKWNGSWGTDDGHSLVSCVKSADQGLLDIAWLEIKEGAIKTQTTTLHITEAGGWLWASFREKADQDFAVVRITPPDDRLMVWLMDSTPLLPHVKNGDLKGEVVKDDKGKETKDIVLDFLHDAQLEAIKNGKYGEVFDWAKPAVVLHRLKD